MKVLHIIDSGGLYGAEIVLLNLAEEQIKQGLDIAIASIGEKHIDEKPIESEAIKRGIKVEKFRMLPGPNILGMWKILKYAHDNNFDIIHSHGYKSNVSLGFIPKKIRRLPLISTLHGYTSTKGFSKNRVYEWLDLMSLKHIDAVVVVNKGMLNNPRLSKVKGVTFQVINNGIPVDHSGSTSQLPNFSSSNLLDTKIINFCSNGFIIGSIGRLSTEKGFNYLIKAFALILKRGIKAKLLIIGEGYEREFLEKLIAQYNLSDNVLMPGYLKDAKKYISLFNIYVISSLTEGLPITLLEAMQSGVPVVATAVGGIPEVLDYGEAGMLVEHLNSENLAGTISSIFNDDNGVKEKLTNTAKKRLADYYSSNAMAKEYLHVYKGLYIRAAASN